MKTLQRCVVVAALSCVGTAFGGSKWGSATFINIGKPVGATSVQATDASSDCGRVVGYVNIGGADVAFMRTVEGPNGEGSFTLLPGEAPATGSTSFLISGDGNYVMGSDTTTTSGTVVWRWSEANGREILPRPVNATQMFISSSNYDGSILAGSLSYNSGGRGFRRVNGVFDIIGPLPGYGIQGGSEVSEDGSKVAGYSWSGGTHRFEMDIWTPSGLFPVPPTPGDNVSLPSAISADGTLIAGRVGVYGVSSRPVLWTEADGYVDLPQVAGSSNSIVYDMSTDKSILVGGTQVGATLVAALWDRSTGAAHNLNTLVTSLGTNLNGFTLEQAVACSADGAMIAGFGRSATFQRESWVVILNPPPPECPGDANGDNQVNGADLSVLLSQFGSAVTPGDGADFNNDGMVNGADLSVLLSQFGQGC